jgi:hypothetical protein
MQNMINPVPQDSSMMMSGQPMPPLFNLQQTEKNPNNTKSEKQKHKNDYIG